MSEEGELLWAQTCCGPVHATGDLTLEPWCYECGGQVFRRRAHKRRRNGVIFDVRAHFVHRNTGTSCKGESINHLAAKDAVQHHHRNLHWFVPCAGCTMDYEVHIPRDTEAVVEQSFGAYRLDVGFCKEDGQLVGAVEVFVTHAIDTTKQKAMTDAGLAWVEVTASNVLDTIETSRDRVQALRSAVLFCQSCEQKQLLEKKEYAERQVSAKAIAERQLAATLAKIRNVHNLVPEATAALLSAFCDHAWSKLPHSEEEKAMAIDYIETLVDGDIVLTFGKHKGIGVKQLWHTEERDKQGYVRWLAGYTGRRRVDAEFNQPEQNDSILKGATVDIQEIAREVLVGHCLRCLDPISGPLWKRWCRDCFHQS